MEKLECTLGNTVKISKEYHGVRLVSKAVRKELMEGRHWMLDIKYNIGTRITSKKEERHKRLLRTIL
jgi:hypothetical protein